MKHGSLFSGIGGFDLAAQWMGWENKFHCEWNPFGQKILHHYWPNAIQYTDITKTDFTPHANTIDILTGGFPCQPYSSAGKRKGKDDERHLWPQMCRAIKEIAPRFVVGENVRGLTNWNGGMVFDEVCTDLENLGYQVAPFLIPACAVNAPHKRERIWFVAYSNGTGKKYNSRTNNTTQREIRRENTSDVFREFCSDGYASDTLCKGYTGTTSNGIQKMERITTQCNDISSGNSERINWIKFPSQSPICSGDDGFPTKLDGITFPKWRRESIKAYGNAIVPQVAYQIFKAIQAYDGHD